ncbi:hypothetical protein J3R80_05875 [Aliiroseovarius sp. Z3]|uniref:hypothetical protein n=1 Tax=Aliiroseovarius sp. Z3 TaxID=2811402 RepID=UPI0023B29DBC|nr:hypothetical protein [Aliiroseovarius sp. Z3]MDE9449995.1 hypothetical protein [Aliiroseovarius sp. Z3]
MMDSIYADNFKGHDTETEALHIGQLAVAGMAACDSAVNLRDLSGALEVLFEEIARKAYDLAERIDTESRKVEKINQDAG